MKNHRLIALQLQHLTIPGKVLGFLAAATLIATLTATATASAAPGPRVIAGSASEPYGLWTDDTVPKSPADPDTRPVELGVRFNSNVDGWITGLRYYRFAQGAPSSRGTLWSSGGSILARAQFPTNYGPGWQTAELDQPVAIAAGRDYVASYTAPKGRYPSDEFTLGGQNRVTNRNLTAAAGTFNYQLGFPVATWNGSNYYVDVRFTASDPAQVKPTITSKPSSPTTTAVPTTTTRPTTASSTPSRPPTTSSQSPASTSFPNAVNTGVPSGVALTDYAGPMTITRAGTIIDSKRITGRIVIAAQNVVIKRSRVVGNIDADGGGASVSIEDSEVNGGTSQTPAIGYGHITMRRVDVFGSRVSVLCGSSCDIQDSWLHSQYISPGSNWHVNGYVSNGGSNVVVKHNTIACDVRDNSNGGGCTGPAASFGDFSALSNIVYDNNLFVASPGGYCLAAGYNPGKPYGSNPTGIVVTNNVFQRGPGGKCASFGPVTAFRSAGAGNVWSNNTWDNGGVVPPAQ